VQLYLVSPEELKAKEEVKDYIRGRGMDFIETDNVENVIPEVDVLYVTRLQKERMSDPAEYERVKGSYFITRQMLERAKKGMIIMHHLPRIDEIPIDHSLYAPCKVLPAGIARAARKDGFAQQDSGVRKEIW